MSYQLLAALESTGVAALKSSTAIVPVEPAADFGLRMQIGTAKAQGALVNQCLDTMTTAERADVFHVAVTCEIVMMTKEEWGRVLAVVYRAGMEAALKPPIPNDQQH